MFTQNGKQYKLVKLGLLRAACPDEIVASSDNVKPKAIVVDRNIDKLGFVRGTGWYPHAVITAGAALRNRLIGLGTTYAYAFVDSSVQLTLNNEITCSSLLEKLESAIIAKNCPTPKPIAGQNYPVVIEVHPFDNYMVCSSNGAKFRQMYYLNPETQNVVLNGEPVKLINGKMEASVALQPFTGSLGQAVGGGASKQFMPRSETGAAYAFAPPAANSQSSTMGGRTSDLVTMLVRNWSNVNQAVQTYLDAIKTGNHTPLRPSFSPVSLTPDHKIGSPQLSASQVYDFARWTAKQIEAGGPGSGRKPGGGNGGNFDHVFKFPAGGKATPAGTDYKNVVDKASAKSSAANNSTANTKSDAATAVATHKEAAQLHQQAAETAPSFDKQEMHEGKVDYHTSQAKQIAGKWGISAAAKAKAKPAPAKKKIALGHQPCLYK